MAINSILMFTLRSNARRPLCSASPVYFKAVSLNCNNCSNYSTAAESVMQISKRFLSRNTTCHVIPSNFASGVEYNCFNNTPVRLLSSATKVNSSDDVGLKQRKQRRLVEEPEETEPHIIYKGLLSDQMKRLKVFSLTTSLVGLTMQPILLDKSSEVPLLASAAAFTMVGFFTYVTPLLIHFIAKKYVTEIVYDPGQEIYTATTFSFFLQKQLTEFKLEHVKVPEVPGPFTSMVIEKGDSRKIPFFVAPESFIKPSHYGKFMGFDKPIDLHLSTVESKEEKEQKSSEASK